MTVEPIDAPSSPGLRLAGILFRCALVGGLVFLFVRHFDLAEVTQQFSIGMLWTGLAVQPIQILAFLLVSERFFQLVRGGTVHRSGVFKAYVLSIGLNNVLPGRLSEFVKALYLKSKFSTPVSQSVAATVLERLLDATILGIISALSVITLWRDAKLGWAYGAVVVLISVAAIFILLNEAYVDKLTRFIPFKRLRSYVERGLHGGMANVRRTGIGRISGLTIINWLVAFSFTYTFLRLCIGPTFTAQHALIVFTGIAIGRAIPSLPAGVGTYEAAATVALTYVGVPKEEALAYAIALHLAQLFLGAALTLLILGLDKDPVLASTLKKLKQRGARREEP